MSDYDIAVVGAGPAGLTAALYARRAEKKVLVLEKENFGGQINFSPRIENYPGFSSISGAEFSEKLLAQTEALGVALEMDHITGIKKNADGLFLLEGDYSSYSAYAVIVATGSRHRTLDLPHEMELTGHGICYCAVCDGAFFKNEDVAVIGGGNTALQDAIFLSSICRSVTIVQNLPELTGDSVLQKRLQNFQNIRVILNATVISLCGEDHLEALEILHTGTGKTEKLMVNGAFVAIGQLPETDVFCEYTTQDANGYLISDEQCVTQTAGLFVAGDCRAKSLRQVVTAVADGAAAALSACKYLDNCSKK